MSDAPNPTFDPAPQASTEQLQADITALTEQLQYLQADFSNYKKRVERQAETALEVASESLVIKLIPVLDVIDLARAHDDVAGIIQAADMLETILIQEGLARVPGSGEPFNPELHDAVSHEPAEHAPVVTEQLRAGFLWHSRLLRPAMVRVEG